MSLVTGPPPPGIGDINADQRCRIIAASVAILVLSIVSVLLRLLSRKLSRAGFWWDDYCTILALVFSIVDVVIWLIEIPNGYGRHIYIWAPDDRVAKGRRWLKGQFVFELFFHTSTSLAKFAILLFYYRIFPLQRFRTLLFWVGIICMAYMVSVDLAILLQCLPIHYVWDRVDESVQGHCFHVDGFFIGSGSANVTLNFIIFLLPIPLLLRLRTTLRQQIILFAIFTLAGFIVLVSIIWVIVLSRVEIADFTWNYVNAGIWSELEPNMAVVCACIPSLRPLYTILSRGVFKHPLVKNTLRLHHSSGATSSKRLWGGTSKSKSTSEGTFSQLDEPEDLRPLGYDTSVRGGRMDSTQQDEETLELPDHGIKVRTEVTLETSDRLAYNDRLY